MLADSMPIVFFKRHKSLITNELQCAKSLINWTVLFQFQHPKRNRQIKAGPFLSDIGRRKIDRNPLSAWPAQCAIANGRRDPIFALFDSSIREADDRDLIGITPPGVDFDLHLKRLDANDRSGINLRWHNRAGICCGNVTFARIVFVGSLWTRFRAKV
jgi:hypothetical protein